MIKEKTYKWTAIWFDKLKELLEEGYNIFDCDVNLSRTRAVTDEAMKSISNFKYIVTWSFWCNSNNLTSLNWCPTTFWVLFNCSDNKITSFSELPKTIKWKLYIHNNPLEKLKIIKNWIFQLWDYVYYWNPSKKITDTLSNCDISKIDNFASKEEKIVDKYINARQSFMKFTSKLEKDDMNNGCIEIKGKKFNKKLLGIKLK